MATVVLRSTKGAALTHTEMDNNFNNLNTDKAELGGDTFTGAMTFSAGITMGGVTCTGFSGSDDVIDNLPAGTKMLFQQTAAPTGWTKETTHNDKALRIVSGTASSGGSSPFSTVFGLTATDGHTLTISEMPSHSHGGSTGSNGGHNHNLQKCGNGIDGSNEGLQYITGSDGSEIIDTEYISSVGNHSHTISSQGGGGSHTHDIDLQVEYVDVIIASKD